MALLCDLTCGAILWCDDEAIACTWDSSETKDLYRTGWSCHIDGVTELIEHRTDAAICATCDHSIADMQFTTLNQDGGDRTTSLIEMSFDRNASCITFWDGSKIDRCIGSKQDRFYQGVDSLALESRDIYEDRVASVLLCDQVVLSQLLADLAWIRAFLVDLVDRYDDRDIRCLCMVESFDRLRHHAIVSSNDEDRDIGDFGTTCTHRGEGFVTGSVDEGDRSFDSVMCVMDLIRTYVLCDATGFTLDHFGLTDRIEKPGLTVVDMAHHGHDRRSCDETILVVDIDLIL